MAGIKGRIMVSAAFFLLVPLCARGQLANPGFEKVRVVEEKEGFAEGLRKAGWKFEEPLVFPEGWVPNQGAFKNGEYRILRGENFSFSGKNSIYLKGHFMHSKNIDVTAGDDITVSFYVKDPRQKPAGATLYFYYRDEGKGNRFTGSSLFTVKTGPEWKKESGIIKIPEKSPGGHRVNAVILALFSNTGASFDEVEIIHKRTSSWLNYEDAFNEGKKKIDQGDYVAAIEDFRAALGLAKTTEERTGALGKIAESHFKAKEYMKAIETYSVILDTENPDDKARAGFLFKKAEAYSELKDYTGERDVLEKIVKDEKAEDSLRIVAAFRIADTYVKEKDSGKAVAALENVQRMKESTPLERVSARFRIGEIHANGKDYGKARDAYERILSMEATTFVNRFDANRKIGDFYAREKDYEKARESYMRALNVDDVNPYSRVELLAVIASTYESEGKFEESLKVHEEIIASDSLFFRNKRNSFIRAGEMYRKEGNYEKERENYRCMAVWAETGVPDWASSQVAETRADMLKLTGDSYWAEGKKDQAISFYVPCLECGGATRISESIIKSIESKIGENVPAAHMRKGRTLVFERSYDEAEKEFEKALSSGVITGRQKALVCIEMGNIHLARNEYQKARNEYSAVLRMQDAPSGEKAQAAFLAGESFSIEKKYEDARKEYLRVLGIDGAGLAERAEAQRNIAETYRAQQEYSRAREEYRKILKMEGIDDSLRREIEQRILYIYN